MPGLAGAGLRTVLHTADFGCWDDAVSRHLGHHRSECLDPGSAFHAHMRQGQLAEFGVLHLCGRGAIRLVREQCGQAVLWLPLRGLGEETINGTAWLSEPGTGLLFLPGDCMDGRTSPEMEGISILIPPEHLPPPLAPGVPLLQAGTTAQGLLQTARELVSAAALQPAGAEYAAEGFTEALRYWRDDQDPDRRSRERASVRRRRHTVQAAQEWMDSQLSQRFSSEALAQAVAVSPRQLQYDFQAELGRTPMAELKRRRLHRLRRLLLDPARREQSIAALMGEAGLLASGVTGAEYRRWCGELPRETRQR